MSTPPKRLSNGFKWTVLSVVIAWIGIVTVMNRDVWRQKARRANCLSNLKNVSTFGAMYADIYDGRVITAVTNASAPSFKLLSNTTDSAKILYCPSDEHGHYSGPRPLAQTGSLNSSHSSPTGQLWQSSAPDSPVASDRVSTNINNYGFGGEGRNHKGVGGKILLMPDGSVGGTPSLPSALTDPNEKREVLYPL